MSYYGDLQDSYERDLGTMTKYSRAELEGLVTKPKSEWPLDLQNIQVFTVRTYLGLDHIRTPASAWELFSVEEGF